MVDDAAVPEWVYTFHAADWWDDVEQPSAETVEGWRNNSYSSEADWTLGQSVYIWRHCRARDRWREASESWCAERGYSFARTVLGWPCAAPNEEAVGHVRSPWGDAGKPKVVRTVVDR